MPRQIIMGTATVLLLAMGCAAGAHANPAQSGSYQLELPRRALAPGESIQLRLAPPAPRGTRVRFLATRGSESVGLLNGLYRAPFIIGPGALSVEVSAIIGLKGSEQSVSAEIALAPGSIAGAEDCLGPGQSFSTVTADIKPDYLFVDQLPQLIHRVEPEYPRSEFVRGVSDTISIQALACRTGRVLDATVLRVFRETSDSEPIEHDPKLVAAAIAAVKQYVFRPAILSGQPVAVKITTAVVFKR